MRVNALLAAGIVVLSGVLAAPVTAALPGANGKIAYDGGRFLNGSLVSGIFTVDPGGDTFFTEGFFPAWSPDGTELAFASFHNNDWDIHISQADGSDTRRVTTFPGRDWQPTWSPDGSQIAFASNRTGVSEIYVINIDGSGERQLTDEASASSSASEPAWSPKGDEIAFTTLTPLEDNEVHVIGVDGSSERAVPGNGFEGNSPDWAPDASRILFASSETNFAGGLYTVKPDGTGLTPTGIAGRQINGDGTFVFQPAFSPDGTMVVYAYQTCFIGRCGGGLVTVGSDRTNPKTLTAGVRFEQFDDPAWQALPNHAPDCSRVAASPRSLWPPNHKLVQVALAGATDPDGDAVSIATTGVTNDEGASVGDFASGPGSNQVRLRAERDPHGDGRTYTMSFTVSDGRGGSCTGATAVTVPRHG